MIDLPAPEPTSPRDEAFPEAAPAAGDAATPGSVESANAEAPAARMDDDSELKWHRDALIAGFAAQVFPGLSGHLSELIGASRFAEARESSEGMRAALALAGTHGQAALDRIRAWQFFQSALRLAQGQTHLRHLLQSALSAVVGFQDAQVRRYHVDVSPEIQLPNPPGPVLQLLCCILQGSHDADAFDPVTIKWNPAARQLHFTGVHRRRAASRWVDLLPVLCDAANVSLTLRESEALATFLTPQPASSL